MESRIRPTADEVRPQIYRSQKENPGLLVCYEENALTPHRSIDVPVSCGCALVALEPLRAKATNDSVH